MCCTSRGETKWAAAPHRWRHSGSPRRAVARTPRPLRRISRTFRAVAGPAGALSRAAEVTRGIQRKTGKALPGTMIQDPLYLPTCQAELLRCPCPLFLRPDSQWSPIDTSKLRRQGKFSRDSVHP